MAKIDKYLTLRDGEITSGQIIQRFDWLQQTLHTRMSKTLELVTQEEEALLTAQRVVRSVREELAPLIL
jgi:hypothetical protein